MTAAADGCTLTRNSRSRDGATLGLFFIQRYHFLTIDQVARAAALNRSTASDQLRMLERHALLGHFGNTGLAGHDKTPKAYFLTRKGWEILVRESDIPPELIGSHKEIHVEARWSPQMYHRLRTVDLMISAEVAVRARHTSPWFAPSLSPPSASANPISRSNSRGSPTPAAKTTAIMLIPR